MSTAADDTLVWSISSGASLACTRDLVMEGSAEVAFTAGRSYRVESMHPIADPPFVKTTNDQGQPHRLEAGDLRQFFGR
jgi:hypothetical protein